MTVEELIKPGAELNLEVEKYFERPDVREYAICLKGNKEGFMSLMHYLLWAANDLEDDLNISKLPFVSSSLDRDLIVGIEYGEHKGAVGDGLLVAAETEYRWFLTETELAVAASLLHGFWFNCFNHLHFDPTDDRATHAVYCTVE